MNILATPSTFRVLCLAGLLSFWPAPPLAGAQPSFSPATMAGADDPCGYDPEQSAALRKALGPGWGYNYDSLLTDLGRWSESPYVQIDSVGESVQHRALWMVTITDPASAQEPRIRIWIHARTHPGEVQGWWVTNEIMNVLLADSELGRRFRRACIVHIMPMYNPDGVELGFPRENANGVDIESNWNTFPGEPEVNVLRNLFTGFMASESPIRIALNMHAAFACRRYFVYHHANGTSAAYASDEIDFISGIRSYWPAGIEPWSYFVSWSSGTPRVYPESWFWLNHREAVMALTYEDMNCDTAGEFNLTAGAILNGISDYLELERTTGVANGGARKSLPSEFTLLGTFPNPLERGALMRVSLEFSRPAPLQVAVYDLLGRQVRPFARVTPPSAGRLELALETAGLPAGTYFLHIAAASTRATHQFSIIR